MPARKTKSGKATKKKAAARKEGTPRKRGVTVARLRKLALSLPEVEEGSSYGTLAFKVRGQLLARLHQKEPAVVVRMDFEERDVLMRAEPGTFYITDHYTDHAAVLVRLAEVRPDDLRDALWQGWLLVAPKTLRRQHESP